MTTNTSLPRKAVTKGYQLLILAGLPLQALVLLIFRLHWGYRFFVTGKGKLQNIPSVIEFFTGLEIPAPVFHAWFVSGLECFGGLLLIVGLCSRPIALMLSCAMTVAYLSVAEDRAKVLNIFTDAEPFLHAAPFFFLLTAVLVLAFGPGHFHLITYLRKFLLRKN